MYIPQAQYRSARNQLRRVNKSQRNQRLQSQSINLPFLLFHQYPPVIIDIHSPACMGVLELVDLPPPPSSCRPKTNSRSISNRVPEPSSSSSLNKPFKSPLPASLASLPEHRNRKMALQSSPVASSSRLPPATVAARRSISPNGIERELNGDDAEWDDEDDEAGAGEVETPMDVESSETEGSDYDSDSDEVMKPVIHGESQLVQEGNVSPESG